MQCAVVMDSLKDFITMPLGFTAFTTRLLKMLRSKQGARQGHRGEDGNITWANLFCRLKYQQPLFLSHEPQEEEVFFHILSITLEIENGISTGSKPGRAGGPKADFHGQLHWSLCLSSSNARYSDPSESNSRFKLWISGRFWVQKIGPHSVDLDKLTQVWAHESRFFEAAIFRRWQTITMRRRTPIFTRLGILFFISH